MISPQKRVSVSYEEKFVSIINERLGGRERQEYLRKTLHRAWVRLCSQSACPFAKDDAIRVTITRRYFRNIMDSDNFIISCKGIRDGIARYLRRDDKDTDKLKWSYVQVKVHNDKEKGVGILCELQEST